MTSLGLTYILNKFNLSGSGQQILIGVVAGHPEMTRKSKTTTTTTTTKEKQGDIIIATEKIGVSRCKH